MFVNLDSCISWDDMVKSLEPSKRFRYFDKDAHPFPYPKEVQDTHGSQTLRLFQQVAPEIPIYHAAVIDGGHVYARVLAGLEWALTVPVKVLSMAIGFKGDSPLFHRVMCRLVEKDVLIVLPSGNDRTGQTFFPANFPEAFTVGALDENGEPARYSSSRHAKDGKCIKPEILAPGHFECHKGTSFASTWIAAHATLIRERFPEWEASQVKETMLNLAEPIKGPSSYKSKYGMVGQVDLDQVASIPNRSNYPANIRQELLGERYVDPYFIRQLNRGHQRKPLDFLIGFSEEEELQVVKEQVLLQFHLVNHFEASQILHLRGERSAIKTYLPGWNPEIVHATFPPVF